MLRRDLGNLGFSATDQKLAIQSEFDPFNAISLAGVRPTRAFPFADNPSAPVIAESWRIKPIGRLVSVVVFMGVEQEHGRIPIATANSLAI